MFLQQVTRDTIISVNRCIHHIKHAICGFHVPSDSNTIDVRECYEQLTKLALPGTLALDSSCRPGQHGHEREKSFEWLNEMQSYELCLKARLVAFDADDAGRKHLTWAGRCRGPAAIRGSLVLIQ